MNHKQQAGKISRLMLVVIVVVLTYATVYFKDKISFSGVKQTVSSLKNRLSNIAASTTGAHIDTGDKSYSGYAVQLVVTKYKDQAKILMNDFSGDGYSSYIRVRRARGRNLYTVYLGPYAHQPEAAAIREKILRRYPNNSYAKSSFVVYKSK